MYKRQHFSFDTLLLGKKQRVTQDTLIIKNKGNHYMEYELQPLHQGSFRPAAMLRAAAAELLNMLSDDRVSLEVDIPSEAGALTVTGDETLLRRAVDNLLRNSVFHNTGSVHIKLSLSVSAQSWSCLLYTSRCV